MAPEKQSEPPMAAAKEYSFTTHGVTISDPWHWLKDPSYPQVDDAEVLDYLKAENAYFEGQMAPLAPLVKTIFEEMKGRIKSDDASVPLRDGAYFYSWRYSEGAQYKTWFRTAAGVELRAPAGGVAGEKGEEILFDENERAGNRDFYALGGLQVSPDHTLLAFSEDMDGGERFTLRVKDIASGKMLDDEITETIGAPVWSADGKVIFYVRLDEHWRPYQVKAHRLGRPATEDRVVYEEPDAGFFLGLGKTQSREFIILASGDQVTSEVRVLAAADPDGEPLLVSARQKDRHYDLDHAAPAEGKGKFFIRVNDNHQNFRVVTLSDDALGPDGAPGEENWQELIAGSDENYIRSLTAFSDFLAISERTEGLDQVRILYHDRARAGDEHRIRFPEATYHASLGANAAYEIGPGQDVPELRLNYESMVTPDTIFDYDLEKRKLITRKVQEIPSGYDPAGYRTERLWATARSQGGENTRVPVSIVYPRDFRRDGSGPLHLIGYGAYGYGYPPGFDAKRLSLLDRGFAVAIAHIRGGDEMGFGWYLDGKLEKRTNSFNDFVDVAKFLIEENWTSAGRISISGRSAGGELMGAVLNAAPELWGAAIVGVPFVDVLNTMLDADLPLTPPEWPEWGNPIEDKAAFELIRSYSPYDNITAQDYPPMLVTGGLNDPRVTYWEPAKWTARLRATKTDDNLLLLKTNMGAGHRGKSGRFQALEEDAEEFAFILRALRMTDEGR
ncbi:MAG: S9 family peptidase [Proteobacteria bacterium]|nr:S9 family peptidase [Pseudomonadota bacterium]